MFPAFFLCFDFARMEVNENTKQRVSSTVTIEVNSSIKSVSVKLEIPKEVITNRQNPKRFAKVFNMCWEVLFAIAQK